MVQDKQMTLNEFMTSETSRLIDFSAAWRKANDESPEKYPLSLKSELTWVRQYLAYAAREIEKEYSLDKKEPEKTEAKTDDNKSDSTDKEAEKAA